MRASWLFCGITVLALTACNGGNGEDTGDGPSYPTGCISTSTGGSFALLADAAVASRDGTTITLCPGAVQEAITISGKSLTIVGVGTQTTWEPPINEPALTLSEGAEIIVENLTVLTTRSGFAVDSSSLSVVDVTFDAPGNYAVEGADSTVSMTDVAVTDPGWGAVSLSGESSMLEATRVVVNGSTGNAFTLAQGASGSMTDSEVRTSLCTNDGTNCIEQDGWAVEITDGGSLTLSGNSFVDNFIGGVRAESADVSSTNDSFESNFIGIWIENGSGVLNGTSVTDTLQYGVLGLTMDLDLTDVTFSADPGTSEYEVNDVDSDGDGEPDDNSTLDGTYGIVGFDTALTGDGVQVSGHNGGGIYLSTRLDTAVSMTLENSTVDNNAGWGIFALLGELTFTDVDITNTRNNTDFCYIENETGADTIQCDGGLWAAASDVTWTGGELSGNGFIGYAAIQNNHVLSGLTMADNDNTHLMVDNGAMTVTSSTLSGRGEYGIQLNGAVGVLDDVTVSNRSHVRLTENTDGSSLARHLQATEVLSQDSTLTVRNSRFSDGEQGFFSYGTSVVTVEDTSFTRYNRYALYNIGADVTVNRSTFDSVGGYAWFCITGSLTAQTASLTTVPPYRTLTVSTDTEGVETTTDTTSADPAVYVSNCALDLSNVGVTDAEERAVYASNSSVQLDSLAVAGSGASSLSSEGAIHLTYSSSVAPDALLNDVSVTGVTNGDGIRITGSVSQTGGTVRATEVAIGADDGNGHAGVAGAGLRALNLADVRVSGLAIEGTGDSALILSESGATVDGTALLSPGTIARSGGHGVDISGGTVSLSNLSISSPTTDGIHSRNGSLTLAGVSVSSAGASGVSMDGGAGHTLGTSDVSSAVEYGMTCSNAPAFAACGPSLTMAGDLGSHSGCDDCATLAGF